MLRSTRIVVLLGVAVQGTAFLRTVIIAAMLGTSLDVDAYNLGLIAPTFLSAIAGAWLQIGFVGRYTALETTGQTVLAGAYRSRMLPLVVGLALLLGSLCFLFPTGFMKVFLPADRPGMLEAAATVLKFSVWILPPVMVGDFLALVLNSHGRFAAAAAAPLVNALVSVIGLWLWPALDLSALIWTLLLGSLAQLATVTIELMRMDLGFRLNAPAAGKETLITLALALPMLPAAILSNLTTAIVQFGAAQLGEGIVAAYGYASRLHGAISQILVMGLSVVLLPRFAALWSCGETSEIVTLFRRLTRCTLPVAVFACAGVLLMGETMTRILFQRGAFSAESTDLVSRFWILLSLSLFPAAFGTFISKFCQAVRGSGAVLLSAAVLFAATWVVADAGLLLANIDLLSSALAAGYLATFVFWLIWLARRIDCRPILHDMAAATVRTATILLPAALAEQVVRIYTTNLPDLPALALRGATFGAIAIALAIATRSHLWFLDRHPGQNAAPQGTGKKPSSDNAVPVDRS